MRILLTGATGGLGRATARRLAEGGAQLVLAVRDAAAGEALARELPGAHHVVVLDLADLDSVRLGTAAVAGPLDAAVLNAAVQRRDRRAATVQGFEVAFGVNHLANALLATLLAPRAARVVLVASGTHRHARLRNFGFPPPAWDDDLDRLAAPGEGSGQVAYATSKLAVVRWSLEAARRWPQSTVLLHDPGLLPGTGIARDYDGPARWLWDHVLRSAMAPLPGVSTPSRSGAVLAELATGARPHRSGTYLVIDRPKDPDPAVQDLARAAALFDWTANRLGVG